MNPHANNRDERGRSGPRTIPYPADRLPPHNVEAEEGVLGAILLDPSRFEKVREILKPGDFWVSVHSLIYRAMMALNQRGVVVEPVAVDDYLRPRGHADYGIDGMEILSRLYERVPHAENAVYHAKIVAEKAKARAIIEATDQIREHAYSGKYASDELAEKLEAVGGAIRSATKPADEIRIRAYPEEVGPDAWHGLAGEIVGLIDPTTEADPIAVLMQFLVTFGNIIGHAPHWRHGDNRHSLNLFAVIVGNSAKARKGTSWQACKGFFERCDPDYVRDRIKTGLVSGEGLIDQVRDALWKNGQLIDQGVDDKRCLSVEQEFGSMCTVMNREGSSLSGVIRLVWETGSFASMSKKNPGQATNAHISILGHVTMEELARRLGPTDVYNGFANRFLWVCARRSKLLPLAVPIEADRWEPAIKKLRHAIDVATDDFAWGWASNPITFSKAAESLWVERYEALTEPRPGILGAVATRAEAQILRLACIYALLDASHVVHVPHLKAALALWRYCEDSAAYIFGEAVSNPELDKLINAIRGAGPEGLRRMDITSTVFHGNKTAKEIAEMLARLEREGLIRKTESRGQGRPAEVWIYTNASTKETNNTK